ncbi:MAG: hypothetical protein D6741_08865, partial [Planctomycetota bacterium]
MRGASRPIREKDASAVVRHVRVAHTAGGIVQQGTDLSGDQIENAKTTAVTVCEAIFVVGIVGEVGVPVSVFARLADGED